MKTWSRPVVLLLAAGCGLSGCATDMGYGPGWDRPWGQSTSRSGYAWSGGTGSISQCGDPLLIVVGAVVVVYVGFEEAVRFASSSFDWPEW